MSRVRDRIAALTHRSQAGGRSGARTEQPDLRGKTIVITGAARGLGAGLARSIAAGGATVALLGLEPEQLGAVSADCPGSAWWTLDVTDSAALTRVAAEVAGRFGDIDVLVANAGIAAGGPLLLADPDVYDRVIEVNLLGSIRTVRAFLPQIVASRGYVLQVASVAAIAPTPMMSAYGASKAGVEAFALALRSEMRPHHVDVGVAYLSWTDTDMVRGADEIGLGASRRDLPGVLGRTYPLADAVSALTAGIAQRKARVDAQRWIAPMRGARGLLPALMNLAPRAGGAAAEEQVRASGSASTQLVGAGGAADANRPRGATLGEPRSDPHSDPHTGRPEALPET